MTTEVTRLDKLEAMKLRVKAYKYVSAHIPRQVVTRDTHALMRALVVSSMVMTTAVTSVT